jgi:ferritin heavy chain
MAKLLLVFAVIFFAAHISDAQSDVSEHYVDSVRQEYDPETNEAIKDHIEIELSASYLYQAYASYYQRADIALPGTQKYFAEASKEEREHAQMLIDYINSRGGHVKFKQLNIRSTCAAIKTWIEQKQLSCICRFLIQGQKKCDNKHALNGFKDALNIERYVNHKLLILHNNTISDVHFSHMLEHHFLDEQIKSIYTLGSYVTRLESFKSNYKLGEYLFDQKLK